MTPERKKTLYLSRKIAGVCVGCAARLLDLTRVLCLECRDQQRDARRTKRVKRRLAASSRRWRARNTEVLRPRWRADRAERYAEDRALGRCVGCSAPPAPGRVRCEACLAAAREKTTRWRAQRAEAA